MEKGSWRGKDNNRDNREFQLQMMRLMIGHGMLSVWFTSQSSSMDQTSPASFAMGSLYNAYSQPFEDDQ